MLCGRYPFDGPTAAQKIAHAAYEFPRSVDISEDAKYIIRSKKVFALVDIGEDAKYNNMRSKRDPIRGIIFEFHLFFEFSTTHATLLLLQIPRLLLHAEKENYFIYQ
jgi:hypothetical protein